MIVGKTVYLAVDAASVSFLEWRGRTVVGLRLPRSRWKDAGEFHCLFQWGSPRLLQVRKPLRPQRLLQRRPLRSNRRSISKQWQRPLPQAEATSEAVAEVASEVVTPQTVPVPASVSAAAIVPGPGFGCCCLNACVCEQLVSVLCLTSHVRRGDYGQTTGADRSGCVV